METQHLETSRLVRLADNLCKRKLRETDDLTEVTTKTSFNTAGELFRYYDFALRECPHIFPNEWVFSHSSEPVLADIRNSSPIDSALLFFGITANSFRHLFAPHEQIIGRYGGHPLRHPSRRVIVYNIRCLVKKKIEKYGFISV